MLTLSLYGNAFDDPFCSPFCSCFSYYSWVWFLLLGNHQSAFDPFHLSSSPSHSRLLTLNLALPLTSYLWYILHALPPFRTFSPLILTPSLHLTSCFFSSASFLLSSLVSPSSTSLSSTLLLSTLAPLPSVHHIPRPHLLIL